jgi:CheY-like chemotaxis protein
MEKRASAGSVLIVDDDEDIREVLGEVLEFAGYHAVMAFNGEDALAQMSSHPLPCVVLLDMMMPVVDGWEFRRRQLADPKLAHVPVVVLSGAGRTAEIANEIGAAASLSKPIARDQLLQVVGRYCSP